MEENIISLEKKYYQSSTCIYSKGESESYRAANVIPRNAYSIHTELEKNPWWLIDLEDIFYVDYIYFFDRPDTDGYRTKDIKFSVGKNIDDMKEVFKNTSEEKLWNLKIPVMNEVRFMKVHIDGEGMLDFDTVILTGRKMPNLDE